MNCEPLWFVTGVGATYILLGKRAGVMLHIGQSGAGTGCNSISRQRVHTARAARFHAGDPVVQHVFYVLPFGTASACTSACPSVSSRCRSIN